MANKLVYGEDDLPSDPRPSFNHWSDFFKWFDMYGFTPSLEYKGKRKYKSWCGVAVSFVVLFWIILFSLFKFVYCIRETEFGGSVVQGYAAALGIQAT